MRFLISAGPTHEYLDDVRFLGNASSGKMGLTLTRRALDRGHRVDLVLGPSSEPVPEGANLRRVVSAMEMRTALMDLLPSAEAVIMTAAVADYRPENRVLGKIKKGEGEILLRLTKNPDILAEIGTISSGRVLVGFALEAATPEDALGHAEDKLRRKRCDLIVLNRTGSLGGAQAEDVILVSKSGPPRALGSPTKTELALHLIKWCEDEHRVRCGQGGRTPESDDAGRR